MFPHGSGSMLKFSSKLRFKVAPPTNSTSRRCLHEESRQVISWDDQSYQRKGILRWKLENSGAEEYAECSFFVYDGSWLDRHLERQHCQLVFLKTHTHWTWPKRYISYRCRKLFRITIKSIATDDHIISITLSTPLKLRLGKPQVQPEKEVAHHKRDFLGVVSSHIYEE